MPNGGTEERELVFVRESLRTRTLPENLQDEKSCGGEWTGRLETNEGGLASKEDKCSEHRAYHEIC